ncbi:Methyltransferase domain-containing protein [Nonomuraea solani]|uniref:Methyltransferase domain-containing protein n=1 Tax=Nonomuraea solani TaxID=1144553 RepID=A0A1H6E610_9ACTN|nr:class I SAM-dependent methyltransferase [Nonomuraea solani]SEG93218.1 Methyltransferase domain-containing protein [Nonomuraea solani]
MPLTTDAELERSTVVANRLMNRERRLRAYDRELGIDTLDVLRAAIGPRPARWLDLCCGAAYALGEAAHLLGDDAEIVGVDLVDFFACRPNPPRLNLTTASVTTWRPEAPFDLITCVHGLHYVGDKLGLLSRATNWLTENGLLVANLDAHSIRLPDGTPAGRRLTAALRSQGLTYDARTKRIRCHGPRTINFPYRYLGANDQAGPNYTGQPAVDSHYTPA